MGSVELLLNTDEQGHGDSLLNLLESATYFECMVAFAKWSAMESLLVPLEAALERGMTARIAVGLSFHLSEPSILRKLKELAKDDRLSLYLSATDATFHPKIYVIRNADKSRVIIGSANLTSGGFQDNYEASVLVKDHGGALAKSVEMHFDELVEEESLVTATTKLIDSYAREYEVHKAWRDMAKKRANMINQDDMKDVEVLAFYLEQMKRNETEYGFIQQKAQREGNRLHAQSVLSSLAAPTANPAQDFLTRYEELISCFHSGGLHRGKTQITRTPGRFLAAMADMMRLAESANADLYALLREHFLAIDGAGVNGLTEILHAVDNERYAVMNQNSVTGLAIAGFRGYPTKPLKQHVSSDLYTRYCADSINVQNRLGLANLTELDALFNFIYWQ